MAADNAAAWPRDAEIPLTDVRSVPKTGLARPPPTQQTARKGRLNFLYASCRSLFQAQGSCWRQRLLSAQTGGSKSNSMETTLLRTSTKQSRSHSMATSKKKAQLTLAEKLKNAGITANTYYYRIRAKGMTPEQALKAKKAQTATYKDKSGTV